MRIYKQITGILHVRKNLTLAILSWHKIYSMTLPISVNMHKIILNKGNLGTNCCFKAKRSHVKFYGLSQFGNFLNHLSNTEHNYTMTKLSFAVIGFTFIYNLTYIH